MQRNLIHFLRQLIIGFVLLAPALFGQTIRTCNGLPATIVATAPGQIMGTPADDVIVGTAGDDRISGLGGNDTICGGGGNDQITGGQGNDVVFGQAGNDTFFWFPGDGNDIIDGGSETDTLQVNGANISETINFSANGTHLRFTRNVASIALDAVSIEHVSFAARGGSDLIVLNRLVGTAVQQVSLNLEGLENSNTGDSQPDSIIVFGGTGNDQINITGSGNTVNIAGTGPLIEIRNPEPAFDSLSIQALEGNDRISAQGLAVGLISLTVEGGPGNDTIIGSPGPDSLVGGDDSDLFVWTIGTAADLIGGEAGIDTLQVVGSAATDNVSLSASPFGVQVFTAPGGVSFEASVEQVVLQAGAGADQITVNTLAGTILQRITLDLRPTPTGTAGDGAVDTLVINGTPAADNINIVGSAGLVTVGGLAPLILVQGSEAQDMLTVNGGPEADVINAKAVAAGVIRLVLRGGFANDQVTGSPGNDLFSWQPGDGSDVIEGGAGEDTLQIAGSNIGEKISFTANGTRLRFTRDVAAIVLDASNVERVTFAALGGADTISFGDLKGTTVKQIGVDLTSFGNTTGDGLADTIQISALTSDRSIVTSLGPGTITIGWSPVTISITGVEPANDHLILQPSAGAPAILSSVSEEGSTVHSSRRARTPTGRSARLRTRSALSPTAR